MPVMIRLVKIDPCLWRNESGSLSLSKRNWDGKDRRWVCKWTSFIGVKMELAAPTFTKLNERMAPYGCRLVKR